MAILLGDCVSLFLAFHSVSFPYFSGRELLGLVESDFYGSDVFFCYQSIGWLGSRVVSMLNSGAQGPGFKSQS